MSEHTLFAVRRCQRTVPVLHADALRSRRFTATRQAGPGLLVGFTSVYRLPATPGDVLRQDILLQVERGVEVPISDEATRLTGKHPVGQRQLGFHRLTGRAGLGRRKPTIGDDQPATSPRGLVLQVAADLGEAGVGDTPGQPAVAQHPATLRSSTTTVPKVPAKRVVNWCSPSRRSAATRWCTRLRAALARSHRALGRRPQRRSGPTRRDTTRDRRASVRCAASR